MNIIFPLVGQTLLQIGIYSVIESSFQKCKTELQPFFQSESDENYLIELVQYLLKQDNPSTDTNLRLNETLSKIFLGKTQVLGEYLPMEKTISYYQMPDDYKTIVQIHERFHAIHHLIPDPTDGSIWNNFSGVPSFYKELLAQLFTYKYLKARNSSLINAFLELNENQSFLYKTWRIYKDLNLNEVEELYWEIRRNNINKNLRIIDEALGNTKRTKNMNSKTNIRKDYLEIPTTILRRYYELLKMFSTETCFQMAVDFNRGNKHKELVELYYNSKEHFSKYSNLNEGFLNKQNKRKAPPLFITNMLLKSTESVISFFYYNKLINVCNDSSLDFIYTEREIDPRRTTHAKLDTGRSGRHSATGGIDFIGWNDKYKLPILGEIKCGNDANPFYALIQLMTYCSELSTTSQVERINKFNLFNHIISPQNQKFMFYIILVDYNLKGKLNKVLHETKELTPKLQINDVASIEYFSLDSSTKTMIKI